MGCFNFTANFSNLPITCGDRIVVIVGIRPTTMNEPDEFSPGYSFTPISVPIRGEYNDYGGIENVDITPGVKRLETFFGGMNIESIVNSISDDRSSREPLSQKMEDIIRKIKETNSFKIHLNYRKDFDITFDFIMEHENIFDYLVSVGNEMLEDHEFWRIPHEIIESFGYKKNCIGKDDNDYEIIDWTHDSLPMLKERCYVWLPENFNDYGKTIGNLKKLCSTIGVELPEQYRKSFLEFVLERESILFNDEEKKNELLKKYGNVKDKEVRDFILTTLLASGSDGDGRRQNNYGYTFIRKPFNGLFYQDYILLPELILCQFDDSLEHFRPEYRKEVIEIAALIRGLQSLQLTWGDATYHSQDVNYDEHIKFAEIILETIKRKKEEIEE